MLCVEHTGLSKSINIHCGQYEPSVQGILHYTAGVLATDQNRDEEKFNSTLTGAVGITL